MKLLKKSLLPQPSQRGFRLPQIWNLKKGERERERERERDREREREREREM